MSQVTVSPKLVVDGHQWIVGTPLTWSDDEVQRGLDGGGAP